MDIYIKTLKSKEILTSYNFARRANKVFSEIVSVEEYDLIKNENTVIIEQDELTVFYLNRNIDLSENDIIFTNTYFVKDLFNYLKNVDNLKNLKLVTHQSDQVINKSLYSKKPKCISQWYGINIDHVDENLIPIPIGLSNNWSPKNLKLNHFANLEDSQEKLDKIYVNFEVNTNYFFRKKVLKSLKKNNLAHIENANIGLSEYLKNLNKFKYTICPFGNGPDTHRLWESIYAGSIPIVFKHKTYKPLKGLGYIEIESIKELEADSLKDKLSDFQKRDYDKLNVNWWINKINEKNIESNETLQKEISLDSVNDLVNTYKNLVKKQQRKKKFKTITRKVSSKLGN